MIEKPTKKKCNNPKCIGGYVAGNPNGTPMEQLPKTCNSCKGKG